MPETKSNQHKWLRTTICILLALAGTGYALWLRLSGLIHTEAALFCFTCLFLFLAIVVYVLPQLQELNLKELKVVLREIKETERRVYAGLDTVRELALLMADTVMMQNLNTNRLTGPDFSELYHEWQTHQLLKISRLIEATPEDQEHLLRFVGLYSALDAELARDQRDPGKEQSVKAAGRKIQDLLKREIS
jgi:hypothetical protein